MKFFILGMVTGSLISGGLYFFSLTKSTQSSTADAALMLGSQQNCFNEKTMTDAVIASNSNDTKTLDTTSQTSPPDNSQTNQISSYFLSAEAFTDGHADLDEIKGLLAQNPNADLAKIAAQAFDKEATDPDWASAQQLNINDFFRTSDTLQEIIPQDIICKTNRCRIALPITDDAHAEEVARILAKALSHNTANIPSKIILERDEQNSVLNAYLFRHTESSFFH